MSETKIYNLIISILSGIGFGVFVMIISQDTVFPLVSAVITGVIVYNFLKGKHNSE